MTDLQLTITTKLALLYFNPRRRKVNAILSSKVIYFRLVADDDAGDGRMIVRLVHIGKRLD
ncbi:MAG: hypothetical protein ACK46L_05070 [Synechococcaceae cyanobacterium]|jgi:hypothetical protein